MRGRKLFAVSAATILTTTGFIVFSSTAGPRVENRRTADRGAIGPDVVAWCIAGQGGFDFHYYGSSGGIGGYTMATVSCNYGDQVLNWYGGTDQSPIIMQNAFRLGDGVFEQIGMQAFMKHSFCALSEPGCGSCQSTDCNTLGIGCADTYWATLNGGGTAPRSDVNAYTGEYAYPFTHSPSGPSVIRGNLQIANVDVEPSLNPDARYFLEAQYLTEDDATWGNQTNNASWREIGFNSISDPYEIGSGPSATNVGEPAIFAWAEIDSSVRLTEASAPDDGKIIVGSKVTDNGNGTYDYEYAIHNLNCDRSIGSVTVATGDASVSNVGFHDIDYNSGEIYDSTDWSNSVVPGSVSWNTVTYNQNPNGNAMRWGTMYNYRFTSSAAPKDGEISLGLFKPGNVDSFTIDTFVPAGTVQNPCDLPLGPCPADVDGNGVVAVSDVLEVIANWGDCGDGTYRPVGDVDGNCCVSVTDLLELIAAWGQDCTPLGACCLGSGGCQDGVSSAQCSALGGDYQGDESSCASSNCPELAACCFNDESCSMELPADCSADGGAYQGVGSNCKSTSCTTAGTGDECSSPIVASKGENPFETNTATPSDDPPDDSQCSGTYLDWDNSPDIWFYWHSHESETVHFLTCDGSSYDTSMALYKGSCDNQVACNGDADWGLSGCQAYYSAIEYDVEAGETYYIRIGGWLGETGQGTLTIE